MKNLEGKKRFGSVRFTIATLCLMSVFGSPYIMAGVKTQQRKTTEPPVAARGKMGQDLFLAIDHRDVKAVQDLLAKGADPNSRNGLEFTPMDLAAVSFQMDVMQALLQAGADADAESAYGTPLVFAAATGDVPGANILLGHHVNINAVRSDGMNSLMMAANAGSPDFVGLLIANKIDVNAKDDNDSTALHYAAKNGNTKVGEMLLNAGVGIDEADAQGETALMAAAKVGHAEFVSMLLKKGAKVNSKDAEGRTALILASEYGDYPEVAKALKAAGADPKVADMHKHTAAYYAAARSRTGTAPMRTAKQAAAASLKVIQHSMKSFMQAATCVSCHQEGLGRVATGMAKDHGFSLDQSVIQAQMGRLNGGLNALKPLHQQALKDPEAMKQVPLIEINEVTTARSWLLAGLAAHKQPPTDATAAMAMVMARQQSPDGSWTFSIPRVPMQSSFFTFTALAVRDLNAYAPKSSRAEVTERTAKAKAWLMKAETKDSEDRASKLLGLKWSGAGMSDRKATVKAILADQRPDGGWAQLPNLQSDAYATGQALYALHEAGGISTSDPIYQKGVKYLLRTQDSDGSWFVAKRALPANNYFDAGFPHGQSQYSSFNGTCWAMMALLETVDSK